LIAHEANYSVDETDGKTGLLYNQKQAAEKSAGDHLKTAFRRGLAACQLLENEPEVKGKVKFLAHHLQVFVNDRAMAPAGPQSQQALEGVLKPFLHSLYGGAVCHLIPETDPKKRVGFEVKVEKAFEIPALLERLK
jgi:hypothetical protein